MDIKANPMWKSANQNASKSKIDLSETPNLPILNIEAMLSLLSTVRKLKLNLKRNSLEQKGD